MRCPLADHNKPGLLQVIVRMKQTLAPDSCDFTSNSEVSSSCSKRDDIFLWVPSVSLRFELWQSRLLLVVSNYVRFLDTVCLLMEVGTEGGGLGDPGQEGRGDSRVLTWSRSCVGQPTRRKITILVTFFAVRLRGERSFAQVMNLMSQTFPLVSRRKNEVHQ